MPDEFPRDLPLAWPRRREIRWFHELADELSPVDGSAVVWLPLPGEFARPMVLPGPRRPAEN